VLICIRSAAIQALLGLSDATAGRRIAIIDQATRPFSVIQCRASSCCER
jgi:hypothetical protein